MNSAFDKKTELRERTALIKARFTLADAMAMIRLQAVDSDGVEVGADPCPCCREVNMVVGPERFSCGACHACGDAIFYIMAARSVSRHTALNLIEKHLNPGARS